MSKDNFKDWSLASLERELERVRDRIAHLDENYEKDAARSIGAKLSQREDEILAEIEKREKEEPSLQEQVEALSQYMDEAQRRILELERESLETQRYALKLNEHLRGVCEVLMSVVKEIDSKGK